MYSTWFSVDPRGYCGRSLRVECASGLYRRGAESEECCDDRPVDGVLDFELGSDDRSVSMIGGCGDREGREWFDICEGDLEAGKLEREVRRLGQAPFEPDWELLGLRERNGSAVVAEAIMRRPASSSCK